MHHNFIPKIHPIGPKAGGQVLEKVQPAEVLNEVSSGWDTIEFDYDDLLKEFNRMTKK